MRIHNQYDDIYRAQKYTPKKLQEKGKLMNAKQWSSFLENSVSVWEDWLKRCKTAIEKGKTGCQVRKDFQTYQGITQMMIMLLGGAPRGHQNTHILAGDADVRHHFF